MKRSKHVVPLMLAGMWILISTAPSNGAGWIDTARDSDAEVDARVAALKSGAEAGEAVREDAVPVLIDLILYDEEAAVRIAATKALDALGWGENPKAIGTLVLASEAGSDSLRTLGSGQMAQRRNFAHVLDLDAVWKLDDGDAAPTLRRDPVAPEKIAVGGTGTAEDPYLIGTAEQLDKIRTQIGPDVHFRQVADIDLAGFGDPTAGWLPVSGEIGSYDGGGYRILNLTINRPRNAPVGLFGNLNLGEGGSLSRIALENVDIVGATKVGALAGNLGSPNRKERVENCSVTGTVSGREIVGGLVGVVFGYDVTNCLGSAKVTGSGAEVVPLVPRLWWKASMQNSFYDADKVGLETEQAVALWTLGKHAPGLDRRKVLYNLLRADDVLMRTRAVEIVTSLAPDPEELRNAMVAALMDERYDVRRQTRQVTDAYGDAAKATIVSALKDAYAKPDVDAATRVGLARAAGELAVESSVDFLISMLVDPDASVRDQAISSLRFLGIPYLERASLNPPSAWWSARPEWSARAVAALEAVVGGDAEENIKTNAKQVLVRIRGGEGSQPTAVTLLEPKVELSEALPKTERKLLEKAYAEVDDCRRIVIEKYTQGLSWPFGVTSEAFQSSANFYTNRNIEAANRYLMNVTELPTQRSEAGGLTAPEWPLIYGLYNSRSDHFPGRMSPEAEALFKERMITFLEWRSEVFETYIQQVWNLAGTENHHITFGPILWYLYLGHLAEDPAYASRELADGLTVTQWCERWRAYTKEWLKGRALNGLFVEQGAGYMKYSLPGFFALYSGAEDAEVRRLAGMFLDLFLIDEVQFSFGMERGASKSRAGATPGTPIPHILKALYGEGVQFPGHYGLHGAVLSGYRPPPEMLLLRRQYQFPEKPVVIVNRRLGEKGDGVALTPDSHILSYGYRTRHFLIGSALRAPDLQCSVLFDQHLVNHMIFASGDGVYPDPVQGSGGRYVNPYHSFQHETVFIFQKNKGAYGTGLMRVYVKPGTKRVERNGWVFVDDGKAYCAIRALEGGGHWSEDGKHYLPKEDLNPILMQAGDVDLFGSFEGFMKAVEANTLTLDGEKVEYAGPGQPRIEFFARATGKASRVNGEELNMMPDDVYWGPYMHRKAGESKVTLTVGPYRTVYDFDSGTIQRSVGKEQNQPKGIDD